VIKEICSSFLPLGWMNRRRFCLQKGGSQEHISLITIMFCSNAFAFTVYVKHKINSTHLNISFISVLWPQKGTSAGRNGSSGVLIMSRLSATVPEKSRGNKKCDEEEELGLRHIFGLFGIAIKWPWHGCMQLFWCLYVHSVEDSTLMSVFDQWMNDWMNIFNGKFTGQERP